MMFITDQCSVTKIFGRVGPKSNCAEQVTVYSSGRHDFQKNTVWNKTQGGWTLSFGRKFGERKNKDLSGHVNMLKLANLLKLGNLMNLETSEPTTPTSLLVKLVRLVAPVHLVNSKSVALLFILRFGPKRWGGGVQNFCWDLRGLACTFMLAKTRKPRDRSASFILREQWDKNNHPGLLWYITGRNLKPPCKDTRHEVISL